MQLRDEVTPHIGRHAFAVLAILKGMLLETLQKVFGHKSITYVLRIHSLVRRRRGNLFWKSPICTTSVLTSFLNS